MAGRARDVPPASLLLLPVQAVTGREALSDEAVCPCGHGVYSHQDWLYDCQLCRCHGPGLGMRQPVIPAKTEATR